VSAPARRLRLAIIGPSPCERCVAACCKQNGHDYAVLLEGDERRKFAAFAAEVPIRDGRGVTIERVLPYRDGRCQFLDADDRCTIYEDRPINCRRFECAWRYHFGGSTVQEHEPFLIRNPHVQRILDQL
jgi:Fe-S-cluster containining protein